MQNYSPSYYQPKHDQYNASSGYFSSLGIFIESCLVEPQSSYAS